MMPLWLAVILTLCQKVSGLDCHFVVWLNDKWIALSASNGVYPSIFFFWRHHHFIPWDGFIRPVCPGQDWNFVCKVCVFLCVCLYLCFLCFFCHCMQVSIKSGFCSWEEGIMDSGKSGIACGYEYVCVHVFVYMSVYIYLFIYLLKQKIQIQCFPIVDVDIEMCYPWWSIIISNMIVPNSVKQQMS